MTEAELIRFLRIPEISGATNHHHVIETSNVFTACRGFTCVERPFTWLIPSNSGSSSRSSVADEGTFWYNGAWTNPSPRPASERRFNMKDKKREKRGKVSRREFFIRNAL
jgi:hypothetical protein